MRKIIKGKKYDIDTAKEIGHFWNGLASSDFSHCSEWLYRKKTGEFFLHGRGGAMSKYSVSYGETSSGGEDIIPLSEKEAKFWVEQNCDVEVYENLFGACEE